MHEFKSLGDDAAQWQVTCNFYKCKVMHIVKNHLFMWLVGTELAESSEG